MIKIKKHIKTQYKGIKSHLRDLIELSQQTKFQINNSIKDFQFQNFHSKAISGKEALKKTDLWITHSNKTDRIMQSMFDLNIHQRMIISIFPFILFIIGRKMHSKYRYLSRFFYSSAYYFNLCKRIDAFSNTSKGTRIRFYMF